MEFLSLLGLILMVSVRSCLATYIISGYRLITKDRPNAGIIELYNDDVGWGRVCPAFLDSDLSSEVCRQLNFPGFSKSLTAEDFDEEGDGWPMSVTNNPGAYYWHCSVEKTNIRCDTYNAAYDCDLDGVRAVTCKEPGYLGCYTDLNYDRVFVNRTDDSEILTIHLCITMCKERGFFYAGVEHSDECFCGRQDEVYYRHGYLSDGACNYDCAGDVFEKCGGANAIAIYLVDLGVCDDPGTPTNGFRYNETDSLRYGNKLYFNCSDGYILEGPDFIQCVKTYGGGEDVSITNSAHAVTWNKDPPSCTRMGSTISSTRSTVTTKGLAPTNQGRVFGTSSPDKQEGMGSTTSSTRSTVTTKGLAPTNQGRVFGPENQEGHQNIYIGIGIASGLVIIFVIIVVVVARRRHKRGAESQDPAVPATGNGLASRNHGDGGDSPLVPRANGEEDLFVLTELTSHSNTAGENHYTGGTDGGSPTQPESADRPGISRDAFGYESIRLPSADSAPDGSGGTLGDDSVAGATDLYANTEFHDVPTNLIDNELYG